MLLRGAVDAKLAQPLQGERPRGECSIAAPLHQFVQQAKALAQQRLNASAAVAKVREASVENQLPIALAIVALSSHATTTKHSALLASGLRQAFVLVIAWVVYYTTPPAGEWLGTIDLPTIGTQAASPARRCSGHGVIARTGRHF